MRKIANRFYVMALVSVALLMFSGTISVTAQSSEGTRFSGSVTVPSWDVGDKWGYMIDDWGDKIGIGFEVVGSETIVTEKSGSFECYKVKIWWDSSYLSDDTSFNIYTEEMGYSVSYSYVGYAYFTKENLALAKFTIDLEMITQFDGSKFSSSSIDFSRGETESVVNTFGESSVEPDLSEIMEQMKNWKYDIYIDFSVEYLYDPPFVMYDYPLELDKKWDSTSIVTINWDYKTQINMNSKMESYIKELGGDASMITGETDVEGSDSTQFTLSGSFEVTDEDTITTDASTSSFDVFIIDYDIEIISTRQLENDPLDDYSGEEPPGGDAILKLIGGTADTGTSYLDPGSGYPQKIESGTYFTDDYETVEPSTIENSFNDEITQSNLSSGSDDEEDNSWLLWAIIIVAVVVVLVVILLVVMMSKRKKQPYAQYPGQPYYQQQGQYYDQPYQSQQYPPQQQQQPQPQQQQPPQYQQYPEQPQQQQQQQPPRQEDQQYPRQQY